MTNTIQNKPTSIRSQDIQQLAQQGRTRALNARGNVANMGEKIQPHLNNLLANCSKSIVEGRKPATPPTTKPPVIAGGEPVTTKPIQPPIIAGGEPVPTKPIQPPVIAGGEPVPTKPIQPPVIAGGEPVPTKPIQPPVIAGGIKVQPAR